jgi:tryptophanyl-tRNA synthetase
MSEAGLTTEPVVHHERDFLLNSVNDQPNLGGTASANLALVPCGRGLFFILPDPTRKTGKGMKGIKMNKKRILTGDRPTGKLHLGHFLGSLLNRVSSQDDYDCFFIIADLHTLTTRPYKADIAELSENIFQTALDYLAVGIDPEKSTIFVQSAIPEVCELNTLLGMLTNVPRLQRIPSLKEMAQAANLKVIPYGLLGYPVLMAADILLPRAHLVPVGRDNQANVELARELARRFNQMYDQVFPIPDIQHEKTLVGTDGQAKMSKSLGNSIYLSDDPIIVERKVMGMYTDPNRLTADTPGQVDGNPVFIYHDAFNPDIDEVNDLKERYRIGRVGDVEVKRKLARALNLMLDPIRVRRAHLEKDKDRIRDILVHGNKHMKMEAQETIQRVRDSMGLTYTTDLEVNHNISHLEDQSFPVQGLAFV